MTQTRAVHRMITKEEIKAVAQLWETKTAQSIAQELGLNTYQVMRVAKMLRDAGLELPKKHINGVFKNLINEVVGELKK